MCLQRPVASTVDEDDFDLGTGASGRYSLGLPLTLSHMRRGRDQDLEVRISQDVYHGSF